jgi:hypothetical protein
MAVIAIKWLMLFGLNLISLGSGIGDQRSERAAGRALGGIPIQAVLLAGIADELLRVLFNVTMLLSEVLGLSVGQCSTDNDGSDFIAADAAPQNLFFSGRTVEVPLTRSILNEWNLNIDPIWSSTFERSQWLKPMRWLPEQDREIGKHLAQSAMRSEQGPLRRN